MTIKSPIPESPYIVSILAPLLKANLTISCNPLVIKAAFVLSPSLSPSTIPPAIAIIFFKAPPISTPFWSVELYILNFGGTVKISRAYSEIPFSPPTTIAVGIPFAVSSA